MRKRGEKLCRRVERATEDGITMCGRRSGRGAYIEVECGGEEVGCGEVRM